MPAFYCENCGKKVPPEVSFCPYCGKKFYSVRCPLCSFTGTARQFADGCPSCGYQGSKDGSGRIFTSGSESGNKSKKRKKEMPLWLSVLFLLVLLGGLGLLIKLYITL